MDNNINNVEEQSSNRNENPTEVGTDQNDLQTIDGSGPKKLTEWKKEPTLTDLRADLEFARDENRDQSSNIDGWLDLRNATGSEAPKKAKSGRSSVQPKLVRKHNEWRYPALSEPFLNTDRMFKVEPRTAEDKPKAKQNQIVLNWQFDTKIDKVDFIDKYVRTAVDEGSVIVRVGWEREYMTREVETTNYEYFPVANDQEAQMIQQAAEMYQAEAAEYESLPESLKAAAEKSIEIQQLVTAEESGTTVTTQEVLNKNCPSLRIVNTKNLFVDLP